MKRQPNAGAVGLDECRGDRADVAAEALAQRRQGDGDFPRLAVAVASEAVKPVPETPDLP